MPSVFRCPGVALLLGGALFLPGGCAATRGPAADPPAAVSAEAHVIDGVPFLPQEDDTCGPSALAMLLRFHGKDVTTRELLEETRTAGLRGTLITDLAAAARRRGVPAEVTELDMEGLRRRIRAGEPVILLVDMGIWAWSRPHYMIAYGFTPEGVVAHSGRTKGAVFPYGVLEKRWAGMGRLAVVVPVREVPK